MDRQCPFAAVGIRGRAETPASACCLGCRNHNRLIPDREILGRDTLIRLGRRCQGGAFDISESPDATHLAESLRGAADSGYGVQLRRSAGFLPVALM